MPLFKSMLYLMGALAATAPVAIAQSSISGSETRIDAGRDVVSGGGLGISASFFAESAIGNAVWAHAASSANFSAAGGVVWIEAPLGDGPPVVFQTVAPSGDKDGGDVVSVLGFNFTAGGAGSPTVEFGGSAASGVSVVSNTRLTATTPSGLDVNQNPLGPVAVGVANGLGNGSASDAFRYLPAVTVNKPVCVGGPYDATVHTTQPGSLAVLVYGIPFPPLTINVPPFEGNFVLVNNFKIMGQIKAAPAGFAEYVFPIPDNPALAGVVLDSQALSIDTFAPVGGSFSNVATITIQS